MRKNSIILILMLILTSCDVSNTQHEYPINSNSIEFKDLKPDSVYVGKDINGKVISKCSYKDGVQNGLCQFYYENGEIKEEGYFMYGLPVDTFKFYDVKGKLKSIRQYEIVKGKSLLNQFKFFDESGNIIKDKSNYILLSSEKDSIELGDEYVLKIKLEAPYFKNKMDVVFGDYDTEYNLIDSINYIKLNGDNFEVEHTFKAIRSGENVIRGIVKDYKEMQNSDTIQARRNIYFMKKYFVKG